jgi:hypothetical protein
MELVSKWSDVTATLGKIWRRKFLVKIKKKSLKEFLTVFCDGKKEIWM